jgi:SAM-dependent methyltransferase
MHTAFLKQAAQYYADKVTTHGPTPAGVDWNSEDSQLLRFDRLLQICEANTGFSLNDFGCGYGALLGYLHANGWSTEYRGFDISAEMLVAARGQFGGVANASFFADLAALRQADYTVASGIFNVKQDADPGEWTNYIVDQLHAIDRLSARGFAFNMLTSYSDSERMRPSLYYGDPRYFFDFCKRTFSRHVYLLHDYGLYEFTIGVRKSPHAG